MIDTEKYDNEGIELSDGGTICFPESDGRMERIDKDGNSMEVRYQSNNKGQEWYELFDTHKDLLAEVKRLRKQLSEAEDVIQYALDMTSDDDAKSVFEDFLGVKE